MKSKLYNLLGSICTLCMAMGYIFNWKGCCILFFGEYPFPENTEE